MISRNPANHSVSTRPGEPQRPNTRWVRYLRRICRKEPTKLKHACRQRVDWLARPRGIPVGQTLGPALVQVQDGGLEIPPTDSPLDFSLHHVKYASGTTRLDMQILGYQVVKWVASPLHFFAVIAVLLVAVILILPMHPALPQDVISSIVKSSFVLLTILICMVTILVVWHPRKLTFDKEAHLTVLREKLGDNELDTIYIPGQLPNVLSDESARDKEE